MPSTFLIRSTECQDDSSGGVLSLGYTMPWSRSRSQVIERQYRFPGAPGKESQSTNVHWFHGAKLVGPGAIPNDDDLQLLLFRFLCHLLVDRIPDRGILDTCGSLQEFYEYYRSDVPTAPQLEARGRAAQRGARFERPSFILEE